MEADFGFNFNKFLSLSLLVLIGALILRWDYILCFVSGSGD